MEDLKEMNEQMKEALSEMMDKEDQNEKLMNKQDIKKELEELSKRQQELKDKTDDMDESETGIPKQQTTAAVIAK